jgi:hypothetical protein
MSGRMPHLLLSVHHGVHKDNVYWAICDVIKRHYVEVSTEFAVPNAVGNINYKAVCGAGYNVYLLKKLFT